MYEPVAEAAEVSNMILARGKTMKILLNCILFTFFLLFDENIDVLLSI